jgi:hypothetical protein
LGNLPLGWLAAGHDEALARELMGTVLSDAQRIWQAAHWPVAQRSQALQAAAQALSGLYHWQDWLFSAPAILPRAHLFAPDFGPAKPVSESDFVQVAMAMRIKGRFVAILTEASAPTPKAARQKRSRLEAQEIEVLQLDSSGGTAAVIRLIDRIVEVEGAAFWQADPIPQGPFAPTAFNI